MSTCFGCLTIARRLRLKMLPNHDEYCVGMGLEKMFCLLKGKLRAKGWFYRVAAPTNAHEIS